MQALHSDRLALTRPRCRTVNLLLPAFQLLLSVIWAGDGYPSGMLCRLAHLFRFAAFSALRVFAISGRGWCISSVVFALSLVPVGTNLVSPRPRRAHC